jgi:hypothetical protein
VKCENNHIVRTDDMVGAHGTETFGICATELQRRAARVEIATGITACQGSVQAAQVSDRRKDAQHSRNFLRLPRLVKSRQSDKKPPTASTRQSGKIEAWH